MAERHFEVPDENEPPELEKLKEEVGDVPQKEVEHSRIRSRKAALELKMMGVPFHEIAKLLEFPTPGAARQAVEQAIIDSGSFEGEKETMRSLMGLQLDRWHQSIAGKIIDPRNTAQLEYMAMGLRLLERKSRLFGLDAPTKVELHNASNEEITSLIGAYQERLGLDKPEEGDPFDLVEGEDGIWKEADGMDIGDDDDDAA